MDDLAHELALVAPDAGRGGRRRPPRRAIPGSWWLAAGLAALGGCGPIQGAPDGAREATVPADPGAPDGGRGYEIPVLPPDELRLSGAASGLDGLLRTIETALAESDSARLLELMVTADEYERILYPAFPAAHPPIGASFDHSPSPK